jgi:hypothetical protein
MSITTCYEALLNTLATAVTPAVKFTKLPTNPPQRYPALIVQWTGTTPTSETFQTANVRNARRRNHDFNAILLIGLNGDTANEDADARAKAQLMVTGIDANTSLSGVCVEATVLQASPQVVTWDNASLYGVSVRVRVLEDA